MIAQNDKMVGELLEKLEEFALTSNTLVIYIAVSRHDIAAIWVAFFSRRQRYRCGQAHTVPEPFGRRSPDLLAGL